MPVDGVTIKEGRGRVIAVSARATDVSSNAAVAARKAFQ
jgi:hypothetical protein